MDPEKEYLVSEVQRHSRRRVRLAAASHTRAWFHYVFTKALDKFVEFIIGIILLLSENSRTTDEFSWTRLWFRLEPRL